MTIAEQRKAEAELEGPGFNNYIAHILSFGSIVMRINGTALYTYSDGSQILRQGLYWDVTSCGKCLSTCRCSP